MSCEELNVFRFAVTVAAVCMEDDRPPASDMTRELACEYIRGILDIALAHTGIEFRVQPMEYPVSSKIPVIISLEGLGDLLFWFHPYLDACSVASELEGTLHDAVQRAVRVPA